MLIKDKFLIKGLGGQKTLKGAITIGGAKNAALKLMASSLLFKGEVLLKNVPNIEDVRSMSDLLSEIGVNVKTPANHSYSFELSPRAKYSTTLFSDISKKLRASIVLTGPLLARFGKVSFPHPGGCVIGERPIDLFVEGFEKMGAKVKVKDGAYVIEAKDGKLQGAELFLKNPSVTATETFMMAAVLARGKTIIKNAAFEPEVVDLAEFLKSCGAKISGIGTTTLTIVGGSLLKAKGVARKVSPDRIEAGSFLILGALCAKELEIKKCNPKHLESLIEILRFCGVKMDIGKTSIKVFGGPATRKLKATDIKTHEYPGFPTDLQAPMTVFLTQALGESLVFETIFEGRLSYTEALVRMGANIVMMDPHRVIVRGPSKLHGRVLESPDLRAGLAFIIAAVCAEGSSVVHNAYNIDRGYEKIEDILSSIGVDIIRVHEE